MARETEAVRYAAQVFAASEDGNWVRFEDYERVREERDEAKREADVRLDNERLSWTRAQKAEALLTQLLEAIDTAEKQEEWGDDFEASVLAARDKAREAIRQSTQSEEGR